MNTIHLVIGNSEGLLNNFFEVLVQDACADLGEVSSTTTRTVEGLILHGLTGRFDLMIVIPNNLLADGTRASASSRCAEAAEAIRIVKKRSATPIIALGEFSERTTDSLLLREAGADRVLNLPFHPYDFATAVHELLRAETQATAVSTEPRWQLSRALTRGVNAVCRLLPAHSY